MPWFKVHSGSIWCTCCGKHELSTSGHLMPTVPVITVYTTDVITRKPKIIPRFPFWAHSYNMGCETRNTTLSRKMKYNVYVWNSRKINSNNNGNIFKYSIWIFVFLKMKCNYNVVNTNEIINHPKIVIIILLLLTCQINNKKWYIWSNIF